MISKTTHKNHSFGIMIKLLKVKFSILSPESLALHLLKLSHYQ